MYGLEIAKNLVPLFCLLPYNIWIVTFSDSFATEKRDEYGTRN